MLSCISLCCLVLFASAVAFVVEDASAASGKWAIVDNAAQGVALRKDDRAPVDQFPLREAPSAAVSAVNLAAQHSSGFHAGHGNSNSIASPYRTTVSSLLTSEASLNSRDEANNGSNAVTEIRNNDISSVVQAGSNFRSKRPTIPAKKKTLQPNSNHHTGHRVPIFSSLFWWYWIFSGFLVLFAGLASGLTVGLLSLDPVQLRVLESEGTDDEKRSVRIVTRVIKKHHRLLVTLLLANSLAMETLPIFLDRIVPSWAAILLSVTAILLFGEILPQALCTGPRQLAIAKAAAPFVHTLMLVLFLVAWPIAKLLDYLLGGNEHPSYYARAHLKALIRMHERERRLREATEAGAGPSDASSALGADEVIVIEGALDLASKTLGQIMLPIQNVFMLEFNTLLDRRTFDMILASGHSRIPVYRGNRNNIKGLILTKSLLSVDPQHAILAGQLLVQRRPIFTTPEANLYDLLNEFQKGHSHIAFITTQPEEFTLALKRGSDVPPSCDLLGIATLEDIIEELIQEEIYDEFDQKTFTVRQQQQQSLTVTNNAMVSGPTISLTPVATSCDGNSVVLAPSTGNLVDSSDSIARHHSAGTLSTTTAAAAALRQEAFELAPHYWPISVASGGETETGGGARPATVLEARKTFSTLGIGSTVTATLTTPLLAPAKSCDIAVATTGAAEPLQLRYAGPDEEYSPHTLRVPHYASQRVVVSHTARSARRLDDRGRPQRRGSRQENANVCACDDAPGTPTAVKPSVSELQRPEENGLASSDDVDWEKRPHCCNVLQTATRDEPKKVTPAADATSSPSTKASCSGVEVSQQLVLASKLHTIKELPSFSTKSCDQPSSCGTCATASLDDKLFAANGSALRRRPHGDRLNRQLMIEQPQLVAPDLNCCPFLPGFVGEVPTVVPGRLSELHGDQPRNGRNVTCSDSSSGGSNCCTSSGGREASCRNNNCGAGAGGIATSRQDRESGAGTLDDSVAAVTPGGSLTRTMLSGSAAVARCPRPTGGGRTASATPAPPVATGCSCYSTEID